MPRESKEGKSQTDRVTIAVIRRSIDRVCRSLPCPPKMAEWAETLL